MPVLSCRKPSCRKPRLRAASKAVLALAAALALPAPHAAEAAAQRFTGEATNVVAVEVPVEVIKDGEPLRGLTANDFEISEGRKKLKITGFDVFDLKSAPTQPGTAALSGVARRRFLLLVDFAFSEPGAVARARQAARDLVLKGLHPTDLVAVATYSVAQGAQLALDFTSDRRQIDWAIENLGRPVAQGKAADPLRLVVSQTRPGEGGSAAPGAAEPALGSVESGSVAPLGVLGAQADRQNRQEQQNRVIALSRSLSDLARALGNVDGRKYVVYLSEGFDGSLLTGSSDNRDEMQQRSAALEADPTNPNPAASALDPATNPWATDTEGRHGDTRTLNRMGKAFEELRRADCVIQAVDIGGVRGTGGKANGREALFSLAKETGGELYENYNDLSGAMGQMLARTSVTYVLSVQPENLKLDGAYHRIEVSLKNAPRGARVVAKPGFYAPRPFAQRNPLERMLDAAETIVSGAEGGSIATAVLAAPFKLAGVATAYVPVLIEVDGPGLLANQSGDVAPAEIYAYALDGAGAVRDFFSQNLGIDLVKVGPQVQKSGLKFFGHLDLPAGDYSLRVLVRNGKTGAYGLRVVPVTVPAFAQAGGPFLLPPLFPEPPGRWLLTREAPRGAAAGGGDVPYPFMMREEPYIPASRPVLGSGQDARLSLVVYNLGEGEVQTSAKVLSADGKEVQAADLKVTDRERGGAASPDRLTASLKAPQLAPGEYRLQVTLTAGTGAPQTSSIPFVVAKKGL